MSIFCAHAPGLSEIKSDRRTMCQSLLWSIEKHLRMKVYISEICWVFFVWSEGITLKSIFCVEVIHGGRQAPITLDSICFSLLLSVTYCSWVVLVSAIMNYYLSPLLGSHRISQLLRLLPQQIHTATTSEQIHMATTHNHKQIHTANFRMLQISACPIPVSIFQRLIALYSLVGWCHH